MLVDGEGVEPERIPGNCGVNGALPRARLYREGFAVAPVPHLVGGDRLLEAQLGHAHAAVGLDLEEALLRELPERYHKLVDIRQFGPGERIVFEPYPQAAFERTRRWIESWNLFPPEQKGDRGYEIAVV